jgi:hypothetical protein
MISIRRKILTVVAASILLATQPALAKNESPAEEAVVGIGAVLGSVVYAPAKIVYAVLGTIVGGGAYVLTGGNGKVASPIINKAVRGDYVLTPAHLKGERELRFVGDGQH